jgi:hypothetical protein
MEGEDEKIEQYLQFSCCQHECLLVLRTRKYGISHTTAFDLLAHYYADFIVLPGSN